MPARESSEASQKLTSRTASFFKSFRLATPAAVILLQLDTSSVVRPAKSFNIVSPLSDISLAESPSDDSF